MGTIIKAICECGFESEDIFAGGGFESFRTVCLAPALCLNCKTFLVKNYFKKYSKCPICKRKVAFYNNPILQIASNESQEDPMFEIFSWHIEEKGDFILPDTFYMCPKCGQIQLRFILMGNWD